MNRKKFEIDATNIAPGRLATKIAMVLMGKHKVGYEPRLDKGDKVVVANVDKIKFTGKKLEQKVYRHHSNYPGGLKEIPAKKVMKENPKQIVLHAVTKMLPKNKLRDGRLMRISFK